ncbi:MAG TPA: hypothetical protein PK593_06730 [Thermomicrobiales bacterium]|nr:hypothetical protein [Chloroflexota bacterium]HQX63138.1 hypothetical protein [Thermomicrobiales bacterium]HBY45590.1 hypothetical protein [Chloroflexota bacterium]HCG28740.1 hypothetical protein [Chloroflexota bacterium]HQZ89322.1 hypothetical protein [Thermomicrobiales bacterium]
MNLTAWMKTAAREHWLPLLALAVPIFWVVWNSDASTAMPMLPLPIVALAVGYFLQPRRVWLVWLGAVVVQWVAMLVLGKYGDPGPDETRLSLTIEAFAWMAMGVLLPVWLGRFGRRAKDEVPPKELAG